MAWYDSEWTDEMFTAAHEALKLVSPHVRLDTVVRVVNAGLAARRPDPANAERQRLLEQKAEAFDEWFEKSKWVQDQARAFHVQTLGKHRADVMREEIEYLRTTLTATYEARGCVAQAAQKLETAHHWTKCRATHESILPVIAEAHGFLVHASKLMPRYGKPADVVSLRSQDDPKEANHDSV